MVRLQFCSDAGALLKYLQLMIIFYFVPLTNKKNVSNSFQKISL